MINELTDIAKQVYDKNYEKFEEYLNIITHPGTRGDMFEGLTNNILTEVLKEVPKIHIGEGFIKNYRTGKISQQTDTIIYFGENEETIPCTNSKIVNIDNVIAFIEAKKTLQKKELHDFYTKQAGIYDLVDDESKYDRELFTITTTKMFKMNEVTEQKLLEKSKLAYYLYHILKVENSEPLRICLGYSGFAKEETLRDNFYNVITERMNDGLGHVGISSLPSLVISEENCLVKMMGNPYLIEYNNPYPIMQSIQGNSFKILIQMILCKIESKIGKTFDLDLDDFSNFKFHNYLLGAIDPASDNSVIIYCSEDEKDLKKGGFIEKAWEPIVITDYENLVATLLCNLSFEKNPALSISDEIFEGHKLPDDLKNLIDGRIISIHDDMVEMITISCSIVAYDGKWYIGENNAGQLNSWVLSKMIK